MQNTKSQTVTFQGQQFEVPASSGTVRGKDLMDTLNVRDGQTLIRPTADGHQVIRPTDQIDLTQGDRFASVGRFITASRNIARVNAELQMLVKLYGDTQVTWPRSQDWVMIRDYPLPKGWNRQTTDVVVLLPVNYGNGVPLRDCFVDPALRYLHEGAWKKINHYFDSRDGHTPNSKFNKKGWRYMCLHMTEWRQSAWIQSYLDVLTTYLSAPYHPWPTH